MSKELENKIIELIDDYLDHGLIVKCNINFPDDTDKFTLDLASMKINDGLESIAEAINFLTKVV